jgi:hypothetical protein
VRRRALPARDVRRAGLEGAGAVANKFLATPAAPAPQAAWRLNMRNVKSCVRKRWTLQDNTELLDLAAARVNRKWPTNLTLTDYGPITASQASVRLYNIGKVLKSTLRPTHEPQCPQTMEHRASAVGILFESPPQDLLTIAEDPSALPADRKEARRAIQAHRKCIRNKVYRAEHKKERRVRDRGNDWQVNRAPAYWATLPWTAKLDYYHSGHTSVAGTEPWAKEWVERDAIRREEYHFKRDLKWFEDGGKWILGKISSWVMDWLNWAQRTTVHRNAARALQRAISVFVTSRIVKYWRQRGGAKPPENERFQLHAFRHLNTAIRVFIAVVVRSHATSPAHTDKPGPGDLRELIGYLGDKFRAFAFFVRRHRNACRGRLYLLWRRLVNMYWSTLYEKSYVTPVLDFGR